jgi:hypothetical protein
MQSRSFVRFEDKECASRACVDGRCCASATCPACQSCAIVGSLGSCAPDDAETCGDGVCEYCLDGACRQIGPSGLDTTLPACDGICDGAGACIAAPRSCCEATQEEAGCAEPAIEACVCETDPYCCATAWDIACVEEVKALACGSCQE